MGLRRLILPALSALALTPSLASAQPSKIAATAPAAVSLLPMNTAGVVLINTQDQAWSALSRFGLFPADFAFPAHLLPLSAEVDFYTDIQPWLGEYMAIAYLPITDKTAINSALLIAPIKDASKIPAFLTKLKGSRADVPIERDYQGITIIEWMAEERQNEDRPPTDEENAPSETVTQASITDVSQKPAKNVIKKQAGALKKTNQPLVSKITNASKATTPEAIPEAPASEPSETPETPAENPDDNSVTVPIAGLAIAVLPSGYLVSATSAKQIEQLIDAQSAKQHLTDHPSFQRTVANPNFGRSLVVGYGDYAQILTASMRYDQDQLKNSPVPLPFPIPQTDANLTALVAKVYDNVEGYLWVQPEGVRMQVGVGLKYPIPAALITQMTTPNQIMQRLPENSYVAGNGKDLAVIWKTAMAVIELQPKLKPGRDRFRQLSQQYVGVDDRDIFPWMNGEYVSFLYPTKQGWIPKTFSDIDLGAGMMLQTSDRPAAAAALKKLDQFVQTHAKPATKVTTRPLQGQPVTSWEVLDNQKKPQSLLARNWVSDDTLMFVTGASATGELTPQPVRSLTQSKIFQAAIAPLPAANTGYFYFNASAALTFVNNTLLPKFLGKDGANNPFVDYYKEVAGNIRSVSSTSSISTNKMQTDGFLALATIRPKPISAAELIDLGITKAEAGEVDGAIANFSRALQLTSNEAKAYYYRGKARYDKFDYVGAVADLAQAIQLDPQNGDAYGWRGKAKEALFDYAEATQDYTQALKLQPDQADLYERRSGTRGILADFKGAIADASQAITLNPTSSVAYNSRCYARARGLGDFKTALADCNKAIALVQDTPNEIFLATYWASRCYVRANLGDRAALEDCDQVIERDPERSSDRAFLEDRGLAHLALGNKQAALADLEQALDVTPPEDQVSIARLQKLIKPLL